MNVVTEYLFNTNNLAICIFPADTVSHAGLKKKMIDYTHFYALRFKSIIDKIDILFCDSIDECLEKYTAYDHILFMAAGVRIYDSSILIDINNVINDNPNYMAAGHILEWKQDWYELHHQFVLVNVKNWTKAGKPAYGGWTPDLDLLPAIERSKENFHDDYTPLWIKPTGKTEWIFHTKQGWNFIGTALLKGFDIVNWSREIRSKRTYYYPETNSELFYNCLLTGKHHKEVTNPNQRKLINDISYTKSQIWILNSEHMNILSNGKTYDIVALPASGFKFLDTFKSNALNQGGKILIYDFNVDSLEWVKFLYNSTSLDIREIVSAFKNKNDLKWFGVNNPGVLTVDGKLSKEFVRDFQLTKDYFGGEEIFNQYLKTFRSCQVEFIQTNLLEDSKLIEAIGDKTTLLHISNIFATDWLNAKIGLEEMNKFFTRFKDSLNKNTRLIGLTPYNEDLV